jgi:hypothetical protein
VALEYNPHPKQREAHEAFLTKGHKRGVLFWGRQVGKSMWSVHHAWISAALSQGSYYIVFKTYNQAEQVVWKQYLHLIPKELIAAINKDELSITLNYLDGPIKLPGIGWVRVQHDPDLPPSRIRLLGSDQADSHRGYKANGIIFDEYADQSPDNWGTVYQPMFTTTNGWAIFMGTPKGYNHFYDLNEEAKNNPDEYYYSTATWRDNPAVSLESIDRARKDALRKETYNTFLQEYELEFRAVQGSVYPSFKRDTHVIPIEDIPKTGVEYITIDFGWATDHPTAINFVRIDIEDRWYVYDEIHVTETSLDDVMRMVQQKCAGLRISGMIADSARPDLIDYMRTNDKVKLDFPIIPAAKTANSVKSGIQLLGQRMKPRLQLVGMPKPQIYFTKNCPETIVEFEQYKYKEARKEHPVDELPLKVNDNHPDGLRYLALHLKYGMISNDKAPTNTLKFNEYGLPI